MGGGPYTNRNKSPMIHRYTFASDNTAGIAPDAWEAIVEANQGHLPSYGNDEWTQRACDLIRGIFEKPDAEVFFVFNGTSANSLALASLCQSYHSVICHDYAHVETDECGAPEFFSNGTKLLVSSGPNGKLVPSAVEQLILKRTDIHFPKPRVLSLTQSTEWGTVYSLEELRALTAAAKRHGLAVHMDGARFANAAAALGAQGVAPADFTWRAGVDVLCFGGTKNGMHATEAVVFFNQRLAEEFDFRCKQAGQLCSKMRYHGAQWTGMLREGAWLRHATHANVMARKLADALKAIPGVRLVLEPEVNAVFVELARPVADQLMQRGWHFYNFIGAHGYRLMCSWATQEADIAAFAADLQTVLASQKN